MSVAIRAGSGGDLAALAGEISGCHRRRWRHDVWSGRPALGLDVREVSCSVFDIFLRSLERKGVTLASVVRGTSVSVEQLRDKEQWIEWAEFVAIMANLKPHITGDEYLQIGRSFMHSYETLVEKVAQLEDMRGKLDQLTGTAFSPRAAQAARARLSGDTSHDIATPRSLIASGARFDPLDGSAGTILLAEDDARFADLIARLLADDYTVIVALDGEAAIELMRAHQVQLLITGADLPDKTAIELSARFRELAGNQVAPIIIILSAAHDLGARIAELDAGAVDYLTRPFDPVELRARVKAQFRMRDLALRLHRAEQVSTLAILTSGFAHELRNPANGIVNAIEPLTQLLPRELTRPEGGVGQLLEVMASCAEQIGFLSRQLLSFRNGNLHLDLRAAAVGELVRRAVALAHRALDGVEVRADLENECTLLCAPPLMIQVLTNLIENAGHAAGAGGWIEIDGRCAGGQITVEVADSGPGVPLELRDRVFEPFFTTKPPGTGSGLGLSLARAIVIRHGGILEIRDRGARPVFVVELPDAAGSATAAAAR